MSALKKLKIRTKLFLLVSIAAAGTLFLGIVTYSTLETVKVGGPIYKSIALDSNLQTEIMPPPLNIIETRLTIYRMLNYVGRDKATVQDALNRYEELKSEYFAAHDKWAKLLPEGATRELVITKAHEPVVQYYGLADTRLIPAVKAGNRQEAESAVAELKALYDAHNRAMQEANKLLNEQLHNEMRAGENTANRSLLLLVAVGIGAIVVVSVLGSIIANGILRPLNRMVQVLQGLAEGNLTQHLEIDSHDEIGAMGSALNKAITDLASTVQSVAQSTERIASAAEELSSTATQTSRASAAQKDQATQVAAAMQQMSSTVVQVSENATKASQNAKQAGETARSGGAIVDQTVDVIQNLAVSTRDTAVKIQELGKSSDQIGQIIGVIDDIADQTNLLALNAAIEAARAGEQGRGFAVVADEVRKLAERTTQATKEIAQMIKTIQQETQRAVEAMQSGTAAVERGVESASKAGNSLNEIILASEHVNDMITHIATAATQQSAATQQVTANMDQIANLVQESSVGAEQSAKACSDLSDLALDLQRLVGRFKLGDDTRARSRRTPGSSSHRLEPEMPLVSDLPERSSVTVQ